MSDNTQTKKPSRFTWKKLKKSATGDMSLAEHLQELRRRVIIALLGIFVGAVIGFLWYENSYIPGVASLGEILRGPYCALPSEMRADFTGDGECRLLATAPMEMFMLRLKVGSLAGLVLSSPIWLYQIWAFITPGLHKKERRSTFTFVFLAVLLFVGGAMLAYFVVAEGLSFLLIMGGDTQIAALTGERYFSFVLALVLIFGVSFEVPLIMIMLNIVGILHYEAIKNKRRIIILALFIFAAFMTPGQDPYSMVALAISLVILVELAMQFARLNDKRRDRKRPEWLDLDDDSTSALGSGPGGVNAAEAVSAPTPIRQVDHRSSFDDVL